MKLIAIERKVFNVPDDLEEDVRDALANRDRATLEEIVGDLEEYWGAEVWSVMSMTPVESDDVQGEKLDW